MDLVPVGIFIILEIHVNLTKSQHLDGADDLI